MHLLLRISLALLFLVTGTFSLRAQSITFQSSYDLNTIFAYASLTNVVTTSDGGYVFPVMVDGIAFDSVHLALIKTGIDGTLQWTKKLTSASRLAQNSANVNAYIIQTADGGYAVNVLVRGPTFTSDPSLVVFKLDASANVVWETAYTADFRLAGPVMEANDGGIIVTGTIYSAILDHDFFMSKLDANGNCLWSKSYDLTSEDDFLTSADYTSDGGVILAGGVSPGNSLKIGLVKTDALGNIVWSYTYDSGVSDWPLQISQTSTGNYIMTGRSSNPAMGSLLDIEGILLDPSGVPIWSYMYGDLLWDEGYGVVEATDGGFVFACEPQNAAGEYQCCLMKTDGAGNMQWTKRFAAAEGAFPAAITRGTDGGYLLTAAYGINIFPTYKLLMVKTDTDGNTACISDTVNLIRTSMQLNRIVAGVAGNSVFPAPSSHTWVSPIPSYNFVCPLSNLIPPHGELLIPNVFTPDENATNDLFEIIYTGNESYHLEIYDRWGVLLFESHEKNKHWDGRSTSGKQAVEGTYYYILTIGNDPYKGFLTLLR